MLTVCGAGPPPDANGSPGLEELDAPFPWQPTSESTETTARQIDLIIGPPSPSVPTHAGIPDVEHERIVSEIVPQSRIRVVEHLNLGARVHVQKDPKILVAGDAAAGHCPRIVRRQEAQRIHGGARPSSHG